MLAAHVTADMALPGVVVTWLSLLRHGRKTAGQLCMNGFESYRVVHSVIWVHGQVPGLLSCCAIAFAADRRLPALDADLP